ncbi:MAG: hypothetical protein L0H53_11000 [Candidatus Nitrosocosmicus sp.]|nr:hypothetical protein [Candidatus Nitrosocosmicus sp.]
MKACGLSVSYLPPPSRRTFDRRLKTMSKDIKERISTMGACLLLKVWSDHMLLQQTAPS